MSECVMCKQERDTNPDYYLCVDCDRWVHSLDSLKVQAKAVGILMKMYNKDSPQRLGEIL